MYKLLNYIAITSPLIVSTIILFLSLYYKTKNLLFFIPIIFLCGFINRFLKEFTKNVYAKYDKNGKIISPKWGIRPDPCGKIGKGECLGCGVGIQRLYDKDRFERKLKEKIEKNDWGFPSGHAQFAFLTAVFLTMYIIDKNFKYKNQLIFFIWIGSFLVCYQRYHSKCHNMIQLFCGGVVGIILGYLFYKLYKRIINE